MADPNGPKEDQYIDIPLGGWNTGVAVEKVPAGEATEIKNVAFRKSGQISAAPQFGNTGASFGTVTPAAIAPHNGNVIAFCSNGSTQIIDGSTVIEATAFAGSPIHIDVKSINHGGRPSWYWSSAIANGVICVVYLSGDIDQGKSLASASDDSEIRYILLDAETGRIVKLPTTWKAVDTSVCSWAHATVRAINNHFVIATCLRQETVPSASMWWSTIDAGNSHSLRIGAIDSTGAVTHADTALVGSALWMWDFHVYPGETAGYIVTSAYAAASAPVYGTGAATLYRIAVSGIGVITTTNVAITAANANSGLLSVYHNNDTSKVLVLTSKLAAGSMTMYTYTVNEDLTGLAGPNTVATTYAGYTAQNFPMPYIARGNNVNYSGALSITPYGVDAAYMYACGAFAQVNASGSVLSFLWNGYCSIDIGAFAAAATASPTSGFMLGVGQIQVNGTTGVLTTGGNALITVDAHVTMVSRPWWDSVSGAAYVATAISPPNDLVGHTFSGTQPREYPSFSENFCSYAYQSACIIAQISSDLYTNDSGNSVSKALVPVGVCNVDLQADGMVGGFQTLPQAYSYNGTWFLATTVNVDIEAPDFFSRRGYMQGVSCRLVEARAFKAGELAPASIDGGLWVGQGAHRLFDGLNTYSVSMPSILPITLKGSVAYAPGVLFADHLSYTTFNGKRLRSGVVEGTRSYTDTDWGVTSRVYLFYPPFSAHLVQGAGSKNGEPYLKVFQNDALSYTAPITMFQELSLPAGRHNSFYWFRLDLEDPVITASDTSHYMDSGELGSELPASARCITTRRDRVFYVDCDDPYTVRSSKLIGPHTWIEFNQNLYARIPDTTGGITALATMDDKVILFTPTSVFYMAGDGPNNMGRGDWSSPRSVSSSIGCIDAKSVISYDGGVLFLSKRGIERLNRDLTTSFVGSNVTDITDNLSDNETEGTYAFIGAVNIGSQSEIRWVLQYQSTFPRVAMLVYNYGEDAWSYWYYGSTLLSITGTNANRPLSTCVVDDIHYILVKAATGTYYLLRDNEDAGSHLVTDWQYGTAWLKAAGYSDFFRAKTLYISGYLPSNVVNGDTLRVYVKYDYNTDTNAYDSYSIAVSAITVNASRYFEIRLPLKNQKCESVRVRIEPLFGTSNTTHDFIITNMGIEVAPMEGPNKTPYTLATVT